MTIIDHAEAVRSGEELDLTRLSPWLKQQLPHLTGQPHVTQYSGGASNWTYRLAYENQDLILRRPPAGTKAKSAHDMGREFRLQQALRPFFPLVPQMYVYSNDETLIGAEFYVMQRFEGIIPRSNMPQGLNLSHDQVRKLCLNVIDTLVQLHQVDVQKAGLNNLGIGHGYARRQIEGWSRRYRDARTWNVPSGKRIMEWLAAHIPPEGQLCVTHNDFRFDNVVLDLADPTRVIGVLDWELATLGDPLMDLGNLLAYWVQADDDFLARASRRQPTHLPGMLTRDEVLEHYQGRTGCHLGNWRFYEVYGLFRISAIAQQIYFRYYHGQTQNPAFKHFWFFVHYLHWRCRKAIARKS
ncbi:phosphotransferase family protein [Pseudomonas yamanorum]|uniref:Phosphotransferase family protein n=1 Tax=Pseudomonas yamanorum TaxID=515393 RepID=A0A7Y8FF75_9PSED|nr:phosphotransferase family protein [Pseudomonas yamanorum]NWE77798.1 phosphotransferase family protein [Pseudomonas yamanorum]